MPRKKVSLRYHKERCILSDVLPYEVPLTFTNRHFYDFVYEHRVEFSDGTLSWISGSRALDTIVRLLFGLPENARAIGTVTRYIGERQVAFTTYDMQAGNAKPSPGLKPLGYKIDHKEVEFRELTIPHPRNQLEMVAFYEQYKETLLYFCSLSPFSIRRPAKVARFTYHKDRTHYERLADEAMPIEQHDHEYEHVKSFFVYRHYSNVYKFYDSHRYHRCEKTYNAMLKLDVSKCFDSIYTHSIAWAVYGKEAVKENINPSKKTFPGRFDSLMQRMNHNETNGIIIGPEFSRLFAEVILQSIDRRVERELKYASPPLRHRVDYEIFRYVDDYFIFFNEDSHRGIIESTLQHALKEYGLYLNVSKAKVYDKPIITEISRAKKRITTLFDDRLKYSLEVISVDGGEEKKTRGSIELDSKALIIQFKTIIKECGVSYRELLNYTLAVLEAKVEKILQGFSKADEGHRSQERLIAALVGILEFVFFIYSVSPRANPTIKLCRILRMICAFARKNGVRVEDRHRVLKYIFDDICLILRKNKSDKHTQVETLYLLIALSELGKGYWLEEEMLASYFNVRSNDNGCTYRECYELNHFSLTVALFYMRNKVRYGKLRNCVENAIREKIRSRSATRGKEAELVLLLFDVISCPYVSKSLKDDVLQEYGVQDPALRNEIIDFESPKGGYKQWFTIWRDFNYGRELDRKKGLEVY